MNEDESDDVEFSPEEIELLEAMAKEISKIKELKEKELEHERKRGWRPF
jgi:hypothetical protein